MLVLQLHLFKDKQFDFLHLRYYLIARVCRVKILDSFRLLRDVVKVRQDVIKACIRLGLFEDGSQEYAVAL